MKKRMLLFISLIFLFLVNIKPVNAEVTGTFECDSENYQCISCSYENEGGHQHFTYYVKSDENGSLSIIGEGEENLISWDYSTESSYFLNDSKDGLTCAKEVYFQITPNNQDNMQVKISFTKLDTIKSNGYDFESKLSTLTNSTDNKKPFKSASSTSETLICDNIKMMMAGSSTAKKTEMVELQETARVLVTDSAVNLELPSPYRQQRDVESAFTPADFENGCPEDLLVTCYSLTTGAHGDAEKTCQLTYGSKLDERFIDAKTGEPVSFEWGDVTIIDWNEYKYTGDCKDVEIFRTVWLIMVIGGPFLVIIFGSIDFFKSVINASDENAKKKNQKNFFRRLIAAIILIALPFIIKVIITNLAPADSGANKFNEMYR